MLIILLLVVFMIGTFFGFMFIKNTIAHWLVGGISFLLLAGSVATVSYTHLTLPTNSRV